jgi:hypothetical protein
VNKIKLVKYASMTGGMITALSMISLFGPLSASLIMIHVSCTCIYFFNEALGDIDI